MNQRHLDLLRLVVANGSFAAAAELAGISPPAVSQAMSALELEWEVVLFERRGRRKLPTAAALRAAASLEEGDERLSRALRPRATPRAGGPALRVGIPTGPALLYAPAIEQAWRQHAPRGVLSLQSLNTQDMLAALHQQELDLAISPLPRGNRAEGLGMLRLHRNRPRIMARRGHPLGKATSLEELASANWALAYRVGNLGLIEEAFRVRRMPLPRVVVECADYGALVNLVARSDLLCLVPHPVLLDLAAPGALIRLNVREGLPHYDVYLLWNGSAKPAQPGGLRAVIDALRGMATD